MKRLSFPSTKWLGVCTLTVFLFAIVLNTGVQAADDDNNGDSGLKETLEQLAEDAATMYLGPIASAFGSDLNGGWFHKAPKAKKFSFDLEFGVVGMGTFYPKADEYKHFSTSGTFQFNSEQAEDLVGDISLDPELEPFRDQIVQALIDAITAVEFTVGISGATIIGDPDDYIKIEFRGDDIVVDNPLYDIYPGEEETITIPVDPQILSLEIGGLEALTKYSFLPLGAPQLCVGTVLGTQATFRYLPSITISEDIGKFNYFGFGIQHNPAVWLKDPLPVNISAGFYTQTLKVGEIFKAKTTAFGLNVSKQFGLRMLNVTPYAGFMFESSSMEVTYDFIVDDEEFSIAFELEGENKSRFTLGLSLRLAIFNINADYNIGKFNSFTVGVMFAI